MLSGELVSRGVAAAAAYGAGISQRGSHSKLHRSVLLNLPKPFDTVPHVVVIPPNIKLCRWYFIIVVLLIMNCNVNIRCAGYLMCDLCERVV